MGFFIKEGRLRPTWRAIIYLAAYLASQLLVQIPLALAYGAYLIATSQGVEEIALDRIPFPFLLLSTFATFLGVLLVTWAFRRFLDKEPFLDLGLRRGKWWWGQMGVGLALGFTLMALIFGLEWGAGWLAVRGFAWQRQPIIALLGTLLGYLVFYLLVAFNEELAFRGYLLQNLCSDWGSLISLLASSLLFGLMHGLNPHFTPLGLVGIALAGVVMAYGYFISRSLWLPIAFHFSWNFAQGPLFSFPVSGLVSEGVFIIEWKEASPFLTGGAFGPEGGLVGVAALLLGLLFLWLWSKRRA